jgi:3-hydroxyisobutyrate dehydrogenase
MIVQNSTIGFIGIGLMGLPMCRQLLADKVNLYVYNRNVVKCEPLLKEGAKHAASVQNIANDCDVIMLCVSNTQSVEAVMEGLLPHLKKGQLIIDFSSISPEATLILAKHAESKGASWLDCPVSGGVAGAEAGTLVMMAGGTQVDLARAMPLLQSLGQRVTLMGPNGAGQTSKVCNQMIVSCNLLVMAEVLAMAKKAGVDASKIPLALKGGFADSTPLQQTGSRMAVQDFDEVKWHVKTLLKDLDMAGNLSKDTNSRTPMAALAAQLMRQHAEGGFAEKDPSTLIAMYESIIKK